MFASKWLVVVVVGLLAVVLLVDARPSPQDEETNEVSPEVKKEVPVIVDVTRDEDKYGNTGEQLHGVGRLILGGLNALSTVSSTARDVPMFAIRRVIQSGLDLANFVGERISGY